MFSAQPSLVASTKWRPVGTWWVPRESLPGPDEGGELGRDLAAHLLSQTHWAQQVSSENWWSKSSLPSGLSSDRFSPPWPRTSTSAEQMASLWLGVLKGEMSWTTHIANGAWILLKLSKQDQSFVTQVYIQKIYHKVWISFFQKGASKKPLAKRPKWRFGSQAVEIQNMTTVGLWSPAEFWTRARSCRRHQGRYGEEQQRTGWPLAEGLGHWQRPGSTSWDARPQGHAKVPVVHAAPG